MMTSRGEWTHKVVFRDSGEWWYAALSNGVLKTGGIRNWKAAKVTEPGRYQTSAKSVESAYGNRYYIVSKLFKGNK